MRLWWATCYRHTSWRAKWRALLLERRPSVRQVRVLRARVEVRGPTLTVFHPPFALAVPHKAVSPAKAAKDGSPALKVLALACLAVIVSSETRSAAPRLAQATTQRHPMRMRLRNRHRRPFRPSPASSKRSERARACLVTRRRDKPCIEALRDCWPRGATRLRRTTSRLESISKPRPPATAGRDTWTTPWRRECCAALRK